ncbi:MAG TPA: ABC transporter permease [Armatimonadota bacterium]
MKTAWVIATTTLGEAMRKRILQVFLMVSLILIIISQAFAFFSLPANTTSSAVGTNATTWGNELVIIRSLAYGIISLAGLVMSIFLGMDMVPTEIEKRTIYTILSKPVARASYIFGKFLGSALTLFVNLGLMALAFMVLVLLKNHTLEWQIFVGVGLIYFQFCMLGAMALLFSILLTRNINVALSFFMFVTGTLSDYWESVVSLTGPGLKPAFRVLHVLIPNYGNFNMHNPLIHPEVLKEIPNYAAQVRNVMLYGVGYTAILVLFAILVFERREV